MHVIMIDDGLMFSMMKDHLGLILNDICMKCIILNQEELDNIKIEAQNVNFFKIIRIIYVQSVFLYFSSTFHI